MHMVRAERQLTSGLVDGWLLATLGPNTSLDGSGAVLERPGEC